MGRSRMFDHEDREENQSPRTTIVGGRPPEGRKDAPPVPTGMQKLLRLAAEDPSFRKLFVERRGQVADAAGVDLSASERAILASVPVRQLEAMIDRMPGVSGDRRGFLRQTAASAVILLGGATFGEAVSGCEKSPPAPSPHPPPPGSESPDDGRFAQPPPDVPPPRPDHNDMMRTGGAEPDLPPGDDELY